MFPMRRLLVTVCSSFLLASCGSSGVANLPADEVLERAAKESRNLESAQYQGDATLTVDGSGDSSFKMFLDGLMHQGGKQIQLNIKLAGSTAATDETAVTNVEADVDVIVPSEQEVYVRLGRLVMAPENEMFSAEMMEAFLNKWFKMPISEEQRTSSTLTPDPALLRAQSEVVKVTRERGVEAFGDRQAYHYDVEIDNEKLLTFLRRAAEEQKEEFKEADVRESLKNLQAEGELWIDAESFFIHKLVWHVTWKDETNAKDYKLDVTLTFLNHNAAPPITPPANAEELSPNLFLPGMTDMEMPVLPQ
jgi:hypothetical protein